MIIYLIQSAKMYLSHYTVSKNIDIMIVVVVFEDSCSSLDLYHSS